MFVNQMFGDFAKWLWIESRLIHCDSSGVIREKNSLDSSLHTLSFLNVTQVESSHQNRGSIRITDSSHAITELS